MRIVTRWTADLIDARRSFTLPEAEHTIAEFECLLKEYGIKAQRGGGLERAFLAAANWVYEAKSPSGALDDARGDTRDVIGAVDPAANVLSGRSHADFGNLAKRLQVIS
jgi:hypothetical protein